jgi:hypothetical protein
LPDGSTCATPENRQAWRFYGNRKVVMTSVTARNDRLERYALADGSAFSPSVRYSKYILLTVEDPGARATYATVSGPGLSLNGVPATLKLLSPRLLRDDPLLAGKKGHYVDARDSNSFSVCRTPTVQNVDGYADAAVADCVLNGAVGSSWGAFNYDVATDADAGFDNHGLVAGGVYTFKIYNDDGWKTVNGQAGKTPIAIYTETLKHLPYSASAMAGAGVNADLFPRFTTLSKSKAEIATAIRQKAAISVDATWSAAGTLPDGGKLGWGSVYAYVTGRANAVQAAYPASRNTKTAYPAAGATQATLPSPTPGPLLVDPTYSEMGLYYLSHDGNAVSSIFSFQ